MQDDTVNCSTHTNLSNSVSASTHILQCEEIITFLSIVSIQYFGPFIFTGFFFPLCARTYALGTEP